MTSSIRERLVGLDLLRGLAILSVLLYHAFASIDISLAGQALSPLVVYLADVTRYGYFGVHLFFVLSGFLISGILLDSKSKPNYFLHFYMRRMVRIFPAYLVTIGALYVFGFISIKYIIICLLYLCNMPSLLGGRPEYGPFWSLSVEEQFYLFWPFIVFFSSRRNFVLVSISLVLVTPILKYFLQLGPPGFSDINYKTWAVMDFLAAGGLCAAYVRRIEASQKLGWVVFSVGLVSVVSVVLASSIFLSIDPFVLSPFRGIEMNAHLVAVNAFRFVPVVILFSGIVLIASTYKGGVPIFARWLCFLGEISYGLYLVHQMIFDIVGWHVGALAGMDATLVVFIRVSIELILSIAVATLSRRTLEAWFLGPAFDWIAVYFRFSRASTKGLPATPLR